MKKVPKIKTKRLFDSVKQGQERTTQKRTDVSQIFDIPPNCDQKVTKFWSEKKSPTVVGKKKFPVGQTLGSSHFEETFLSMGGGTLLLVV